MIFAPSLIEPAARIARIINHWSSPPGACPIYRNMAALLDDLDGRPCRPGLIILLAADHRELASIASMAAWFENVPLVLMIPDHRRQTLALAHRLRPRYLIWPDTSLCEMSVVLRHMYRPKAKRRAPPQSTPPRTILFQNPGRWKCFILHRRRRKASRASLDTSRAPNLRPDPRPGRPTRSDSKKHPTQ